METNATAVLALADRLQVSCVVAACEQFLVSHLNHENVIQALFLCAPTILHLAVALQLVCSRAASSTISSAGPTSMRART